MQTPSTDVSLLQKQIQKAARELVNDRTDDTDDDSIAVLFTGNWHDSFPRRLVVSQDLSAVEKITWQVIRLSILDPAKPGSTPRREDLALMINCSAPTVTTCRHMLRIHRWMTYCKSVRDRGRFVGDIYLLNDEPLSLQSTLELDQYYIKFLELHASGGNKRLRTAATQVLNQIDGLKDVRQPNETEMMAERLTSSLGFGMFGDQKTIQSKNFSAVEDAIGVDNTELSGLEPHQSKNFALDEAHHRKNFAPVSKKFFSSPRSSCCFNNKLNITNTRGREIVPTEPEPVTEPLSTSSINDFRDLADIGRWGSAETTPKALLSTVSTRLVADCITKYTDWLFSGKASTASVIIRKIKALPQSTQEMVLFQLIGREASHFHGWGSAIRNPVGYVNELAKRAKTGDFLPDQWALELFQSATDGTLPNFEDSPEKLIAKQRMEQEAGNGF